MNRRQWITELAGGDYEEMRKRVMEAIKVGFKPEFINRIDEIIIFKALSMEDLKSIVDLQLALLAKRTRERFIDLEFTDKLKELLAKEGYDPAYGARPLKRLIQKKIQNQLALLMLKGELHEGERVKVTVNRKGDVAFERQ